MKAASLVTCLWFDDQAEEAARYYCGLFDDAEITHIYPQRGSADGRAFLVQWTMLGQKFSGMNGGPHYKLTPAMSIEVHLETQAEVDALWDTFLDSGAAPQRCGWLTDQFGVSWQIIPRGLMALMTTEDDARAQRVTQAMMKMIKLDINALQAAADS